MEAKDFLEGIREAHKSAKEEKLFKEFQLLSQRVKMLSGIIQNEGFKPTDEQLMEWVDEVNGVINSINYAKEDVVRLFQD